VSFYLTCSVLLFSGEIGDTWIFGVQSDPVKTANFRAASRARAACIADPHCPSDTAAFFNFSRLLVKVPEHTWGERVGDKGSERERQRQS